MTYDHAGRLLKTYHQIGDSGTEYEISSRSYNERDELSRNRIANNQDVDYTYNIRKWLTGINNPDACSFVDLFALEINYNTVNTDLGTSALYNGNISSIEWRTGTNCMVGGVTRNKAAYGFTYDAANRLSGAKYGEYNSGNSWVAANVDRYTVDNITYDDNGNIKTLRRKGLTGSSTYGIIDEMTYTYSSSIPNRLTTVAEAGLIDRGFKKVSAGASGYTYDNNGNVNADGYRGITGTTYYPHNLPAKITYSATRYIEYTYDASGRKWKSKTVDGATTTEKTYFGGIEYNGANLEAIYHAEGRAVPSGTTYEYQYSIKDHLGNSRVMFKLVGTTPTIIQEGHYYPFGMEMEGFTAGNNPYRYNGKELNQDLGLNWYAYGARYYDPAIGRFTGVDPIAEDFPHVSTYNYAENEPIGHVDLHGLQKAKPPLLQQAAQWLGIDMEAGASNLDQPQTAEEAEVIEFRRDAVHQLASDLEELRDLQEETIPGAKMIRLAHEGDVGGVVKAGVEETVGAVIGGIVVARLLGRIFKWAVKAKKPVEAYNRRKHYGKTPTSGDRKALKLRKDEVADHDPPLVQRYYEGDAKLGEKPGYRMTPAERRASANDRSRMKRQSRSDSDRQGGQMSKYSKDQKKKHDL